MRTTTGLLLCLLSSVAHAQEADVRPNLTLDDVRRAELDAVSAEYLARARAKRLEAIEMLRGLLVDEGWEPDDE